MNLTQEITNGMTLSFDEKVIETAKKFMEDNGFKKTLTGKKVACNYVQDILADNPTLSTALQAAIIAL